MKNLKRVLSLGLASVMLLGMMVVGASAKDFTDAADIEHSEAVSILVALKIINGKEDGSYFDPKGSVTRGEMAKMIAVALQGGNDVNTGVKTTPSFSDIGGHWAEPWIEYCADIGIISGRGDGTFDPNGNVTGLEVTKMVLTALGYEAEPYKLVGAQWATNVDKLARTADPKLYKELANVIMNQPATRDSAAQIIWNGLQNDTRTVRPAQNTSNGEVTWEYGSSGKSLITERYDAFVVEGTYAGNYNYNSADGAAEKGDIIVSLGKINPADTSAVGVVHFPSDMGIDNIGEKVKVIWVDGKNGDSGKPDKHDTIFGVFNTGETKVVRGNLSQIKDSKSSSAKLNINGTDYSTTNTVSVVTNYTSATGTSYSAIDGDADSNSALTLALKLHSKDPIKAVFDNNGLLYRIYLTTSYLAPVTAINATDISLGNGIGKLKIADHDVEDGLVKGDVVVVTPLYKTSYTDERSTVVVTKAKKTSGEVEGFKDDESVTVNGQTIKINYYNATDTTNSAKTNKVDQKYKMLSTITGIETNDIITSFKGTGNEYIGETVDLYLVNDYVGAAVQTSEGAKNYSVITEVKKGAVSGSVFSSMQLQVMTADGTKEIITVSKDSDDKATHDPNANGITAADYAVGDIITYTFDKDDNAKVTVVGKVTFASANTSGIAYNSKSKTVDGKVTVSDCVIFVQTSKKATGNIDKTGDDESYGVLTNAEYEVYDIRALDDITVNDNKNKAVTVATKDGKVVAVFMDLKDEPAGAADNSVYGIVSAVGNRVKDYTEYTIQSNGDEYVVKYEGTLAKGNLVELKPTAGNTYKDGKITVFTSSSDRTVVSWVKEYSAKDNTLSFWANKPTENKVDGKVVSHTHSSNDPNYTYALDKDCKIIYVDKKDSKSTAEASVEAFSELSGTKNVLFVYKLDSDNNKMIKVMFVETSAKKDIG